MRGISAGLASSRIVHLADLNLAFVEAVEDPRVDPHFSEVLAQRVPMRAAAAYWSMMDADHLVAPDVGDRLA